MKRFTSKGFTLIDLMLVVAIIGILVATALPLLFAMKYAHDHHCTFHEAKTATNKELSGKSPTTYYIITLDGQRVRCMTYEEGYRGSDNKVCDCENGVTYHDVKNIEEHQGGSN